MSRRNALESSLQSRLAPTHVAIVDESLGHAPGKGPESHLRAIVVADAFDGLSRVARHRHVFEAAAGVLADGLHALAVETYTPTEWDARQAQARLDAPPCQGGSRHDRT